MAVRVTSPQFPDICEAPATPRRLAGRCRWSLSASDHVTGCRGALPRWPGSSEGCGTRARLPLRQRP